MSPEPITVGTVSLALARKSIEKVFDDLYAVAKDRIGPKLRYLQAKQKIDTISKNLRNARMIKTIWQFEEPVDLFGFYYPSQVEYDKKRRPVSDLAQLPPNSNIIVEGTVGQGKSIFCRYLTCQELISGRAIPLLFELRKIRSGQTLAQRLLDELEILGFANDKDLFDSLAEYGKLTLFLDGFDEVPEGQRIDLISEIENLARRFPRMRILVTSRPESGIQASSFFKIVNLSPLRRGEYKEVVKRICHEKPVAMAILAGIAKSKENVKEILTTPLMVTLLVFRYKLDQSIPENVAAFYGDLFAVLLQRHDKAKPGYTRPRVSGASDAALAEAFDALCYLTRKSGANNFNGLDFRRYAKDALKACGLTLDELKFLEDIANITCLVLRDGDDWHFIHKSVQEYHAACFVRSRPEDIARSFYNAMATHWLRWREELFFLEQMDQYRCGNWFLIPQYMAVLGHDFDGRSVSLEDVKRVFGDDIIGWRRAGEYVCRIAHRSSFAFYPMSRSVDTILRYVVTIPFRPIKAAVASGIVQSLPVSEGREEAADGGVVNFAVADLLNVPEARTSLVAMATEIFKDIRERLMQVQKATTRVDRSKALFDF